MTLVLKNPSPSQFPPGGWCFRDNRTGWTIKGSACFEHNASLLADKIIKHRRANPHIYKSGEVDFFDHNLVIQEIYAYKKATHPDLFVGHDAPVKRSIPTIAPASKCPTCGGNEFEPTYCPTCGGRKINGYKCKSCGTKL